MIDHQQREFLAGIVSLVVENCETHTIEGVTSHQIQTPDQKLYIIGKDATRIGDRMATDKQLGELDNFLKDHAYDISEQIKSIVFGYDNKVLTNNR